MLRGLLMAGLIGCGPDPAMVAEIEQLETKVSDLEKVNERLESEAEQLNAEVRRLNGEIEHQKKVAMLAEIGVSEGQPLHATISTSLGDIRCELLPSVAPMTVRNFVGLSEGTREWTHPSTGEKSTVSLYSNSIFHRVIPEFMIQGGDPLGNGTGGPGYKFEDEVSSDVLFDAPGLLAMANAGPGTNGSQFFITDRSTPSHLNGKHTIFGQCENLDVVEAIAEVERDGRDKPLEFVVLYNILIERG